MFLQTGVAFLERGGAVALENACAVPAPIRRLEHACAVPDPIRRLEHGFSSRQGQEKHAQNQMCSPHNLASNRLQ